MKRILTLTLALSLLLGALSFPTYAQAGAEKFSDVSPTSWYYPYVDRLTREGVISGVGGGDRFAPHNTISASELITMVIKATDGFQASDASYDHWAWEYMERAYELKIITREEMPRELWSQPIERQKMAVIFDRSMEYILGEEPAADADEYAARIPDWDSICTVCKPSVAQVYAKGIITGTDSKGTFAPTRTMTRAEAATVIVKLIDISYRTARYDGIPFVPALDVNEDGTMKMAAAEKFIMATLEKTRLYKENGKYYVSCTYPSDMPEGFEMHFGLMIVRNNAPIISYRTNSINADILIPKTGSFTRELVGMSSLNELSTVSLGISVKAPQSTIDDYRKQEGVLGIHSIFTSGVVTEWDVYIDYTAGGYKQLTYDRTKLFQW